MEKVEKIMEKYRIYLGVKDVKVVVRPYKTRTAFTKLSSPPIIHLNEYLIDDEEVLEYLILRELIHIKLNMFRSRYLTSFCQRRMLRRLGKRWKSR